MGRVNKKILYLKQKKSGVFLTGFTLVEMLVAISIFAVVATLAASLFSTFANNQNKTKVSQELLNNSQYVLEIISREVKNNEIIAFGAQQCQSLDSALYTQCLLFVRESGETAGFVYDSVDQSLAYVLLDCQKDGVIYSNCDIASTQEPTILLSADYNQTRIDDLAFVLKPDDFNPYFDQSGSYNQQPQVTIKLKVSYPSSRLAEQATHYLQTTVSSRVYKR